MLVFYVLVFAGVLASGTLIALLAPRELSTGAELTSPSDIGPLEYLAALLPGGLIYALAGILVTGLVSGRVGLRDLRSRLVRWRVGVRWYAVALLTAPLLETAILGAFSRTSRDYLPGIITADHPASLLVAGLLAVLVIPFLEEIGWTGFATAELSKRHGVLATGLIVGVPWGVLHLPLYAATASGSVPLALYLPVVAFSVLLPYRVLMVWVYDHTQSVLIAVLMHVSINAFAFVLPASSAMVGVPDLIFNLVFGAALWVLVGALAVAGRGHLSRRRFDRLVHSPG